MIAFVFPGQGSQSVGMGAELFDQFSDLTKKADKILGYSIKQLCMEDHDNNLGQTNYTQPALYVVNAMSYLKKVEETGQKPDYVAGHSLGEYNALFAAGAIDFESGLKLVKKRGELMSQATGGGMAAVIGLTEETIKNTIAVNNLSSIDIANLNSPTQIVISGPKDAIVDAKAIFENAGAMMYIVLQVSGAFHSRYMKESKQKFEEVINQVTFSEIQIPVISNVYACPYSNDSIAETLANQIVNPVRWTESIKYLIGKGVDNFVQVGPGNVLKGLIRAIQRPL